MSESRALEGAEEMPARGRPAHVIDNDGWFLESALALLDAELEQAVGIPRRW